MKTIPILWSQICDFIPYQAMVSFGVIQMNSAMGFTKNTMIFPIIPLIFHYNHIKSPILVVESHYTLVISQFAMV